MYPLELTSHKTYVMTFADFKHVCVLEPQNKTASDAEKRLRKMMN